VRWPELVLAAALSVLAPTALQAQVPSRLEVQQAADAVRGHPDLGGLKKTRTLRLRDQEKKAALLVVGLRRWILLRGPALARASMPLPTHVQSLDIRPETLPREVGAAAADLWQRGESIAALSLLYRGALSRLVHGLGVSITAASTEGECVSLATTQLPAPGLAYFSALVRAWQLAVYGNRLPDAAQVLALCRDFDAQLAPPPVAAA
jgi:hypothetical protein